MSLTSRLAEHFGSVPCVGLVPKHQCITSIAQYRVGALSSNALNTYRLVHDVFQSISVDPPVGSQGQKM